MIRKLRICPALGLPILAFVVSTFAAFPVFQRFFSIALMAERSGFASVANREAGSAAIFISTKGAKFARRSQNHALDALLEQNDVAITARPSARALRQGFVSFAHPWSSLCFHSLQRHWLIEIRTARKPR